MAQDMTMRDVIQPQAVVASLDAPSKRDVLESLAATAAQALSMDAHAVFDVLWERERLGTTGVGAGIAIPHGRVPGLTKVCGFFARLSQPVAFESIDDKPVDLVFMLLAPESAGADHLHALAAVSRQLRDQALCGELRKAKDESALYRLLTGPSEQRAA